MPNADQHSGTGTDPNDDQFLSIQINADQCQMPDWEELRGIDRQWEAFRISALILIGIDRGSLLKCIQSLYYQCLVAFGKTQDSEESHTLCTHCKIKIMKLIYVAILMPNLYGTPTRLQGNYEVFFLDITWYAAY